MPARVKICGLNAPDSMAAALGARADLVGLVFFPASPRNVTIEMGSELADFARGSVEIVALTVDADDALLERIMREVNPDMLQLHGTETPARVAAIRARWGKPVMKAIKVAAREDALGALEYAEAADLILFDAKAPKGAALPGGNGIAFDWRLLDYVKDKVAFMLSGGLTPATVADAICTTGAKAVDVSSGVESRPGLKDPDLIAAFIRAAHAT